MSPDKLLNFVGYSYPCTLRYTGLRHRVREYYDGVGERYIEYRCQTNHERLISQRELDFVLRHVTKGAKVLEIGPGPGYFTEHLVHKASSVLAIDLSAEMLEALQSRVRANNLRVLQADINQINISVPDFGRYDCVVCIRVLMHVEAMEIALSQIHQALVPGANAIFDLWNHHSYPVLMGGLKYRLTGQRPPYR